MTIVLEIFLEPILIVLNTPTEIFDMAKKYMRGREPTRENIDKLCRHLASKGFSWNDISPVISKFRSNDDYESWD